MVNAKSYLKSARSRWQLRRCLDSIVVRKREVQVWERPRSASCA